MKKIKYINGESIGECDLIGETKQIGAERFADFICKCGNIFNARIQHVRHRKIVSCGCYGRLMTSISKTTHGFTVGRKIRSEHSTWTSIKSRCRNKKDKNYIRYGARGIDMCERWFNSFENFITDMGEKPTNNHSIDRIDNDGNYDPNNCKWSTKKEQCRNTRRNLILEYKGEKKCLAEWVEILKLDNYRAVLKRIIYRKWTVEKAFETPIKIN